MLLVLRMLALLIRAGILLARWIFSLSSPQDGKYLHPGEFRCSIPSLLNPTPCPQLFVGRVQAPDSHFYVVSFRYKVILLCPDLESSLAVIESSSVFIMSRSVVLDIGLTSTVGERSLLLDLPKHK